MLVIALPAGGYPFNRECATRSQKWNVPSEPAVVKTAVLTGWNRTSLTLHTLEICRESGGSRWQRNVKLVLLFHRNENRHVRK